MHTRNTNKIGAHLWRAVVDAAPGAVATPSPVERQREAARDRRAVWWAIVGILILAAVFTSIVAALLFALPNKGAS